MSFLVEPCAASLKVSAGQRRLFGKPALNEDGAMKTG
jgi:hypothetical protein